LQQLYTTAKSSGQTEEIDSQVFSDYLDQDIVNEAFVLLIIGNNLAYNLVESTDFYIFCQVLNPKAGNVVPKVYSTVEKKITQAFQNHKDIIQEKLQSVLTYIYWKIDIWTSLNNLLLLEITADFVDCKKEKYTKALIVLSEVDSYSRQAQFDTLLPVLQDYNIVQKVGTVIGNNSSTNNTFTQAYKAYLLKEDSIK
jgi:hypothetical protein